MGVADEVDRHAMVVAHKSRKEDKEVVLTAIPNPPQAKGVKEELEIANQMPTHNASTVEKRATRRESLEKSH